MSYALRAYWDDDAHHYSADDCEELGSVISQNSRALSPSAEYSKRSAHVQSLRNRTQWAQKYQDGNLVPSTTEAISAAERVINLLPEGCLGFDLAVGSSGEINLFFPTGDQVPFQLLISPDGLISYFGEFNGDEFADDDVSPGDFPYMRLLKLLCIR